MASRMSIAAALALIVVATAYAEAKDDQAAEGTTVLNPDPTNSYPPANDLSAQQHEAILARKRQLEREGLPAEAVEPPGRHGAAALRPPD